MAGADHRPAMKITDHKTEAILEGRKIKWTDDGKEALIKMGECRHAAVTPIAQTSGSR